MDFVDLRVFKFDDASEETFVYSRPTPIGQFSIDEHRRVTYDASQRRMLSTEPLELGQPLSVGFDAFEDKPFKVVDPLSSVLYCASGTFDVVTWRGVLTKISMTPLGERYRLLATRLASGQICLVERKSPPPKQSTHQLRMAYWGRRFENLLSFISGQSSGSDSDKITGGSNVTEYCVVMNGSINAVRLLFAAEMDAMRPDGSFVELKVAQRGTNSPLKQCRWWAQCTFAGIQTIMVGWRDRGGRLLEVQPVPVASLFHDSRQEAFLGQFLSWLHSRLPPEKDILYEMEPSSDGRGMILRRSSEPFALY